MSDPWNLTPRESQVMEGMVKHGGVHKLIAQDLEISPKTVGAFYARACEKIGGKTHTIALLEYDRWMRGTQGKVVLCPNCNGAGHVYREAA